MAWPAPGVQEAARFGAGSNMSLPFIKLVVQLVRGHHLGLHVDLGDDEDALEAAVYKFADGEKDLEAMQPQRWQPRARG